MEIINKINMKKENKVVEYDLHAGKFNWEIAPGKTIEAWGFNKQLPGPSWKPMRVTHWLFV